MPQGLIRAFHSMKVWTALGALVLAVAAALGLSADVVKPIITAIIGLAGAVILATGYEDAKDKEGGTILLPDDSEDTEKTDEA